MSRRVTCLGLLSSNVLFIPHSASQKRWRGGGKQPHHRGQPTKGQDLMAVLTLSLQIPSISPSSPHSTVRESLRAGSEGFPKRTAFQMTSFAAKDCVLSSDSWGVWRQQGNACPPAADSLCSLLAKQPLRKPPPASGFRAGQEN